MLQYVTKILSLLGISAGIIYGLLVFGIIYIEVTFSFSILPMPLPIIEKIPGINVVENKTDLYCYSKSQREFPRELLPYLPKLLKYCDTEAVHRVYIYSRIIRKSWSYYISDSGSVIGKSYWVTM